MPAPVRRRHRRGLRRGPEHPAGEGGLRREDLLHACAPVQPVLRPLQRRRLQRRPVRMLRRARQKIRQAHHLRQRLRRAGKAHRGADLLPHRPPLAVPGRVLRPQGLCQGRGRALSRSGGGLYQGRERGLRGHHVRLLRGLPHPQRPRGLPLLHPQGGIRRLLLRFLFRLPLPRRPVLRFRRLLVLSHVPGQRRVRGQDQYEGQKRPQAAGHQGQLRQRGDPLPHRLL